MYGFTLFQSDVTDDEKLDPHWAYLKGNESTLRIIIYNLVWCHVDNNRY